MKKVFANIKVYRYVNCFKIKKRFYAVIKSKITLLIMCVAHAVLHNYFAQYHVK